MLFVNMFLASGCCGVIELGQCEDGSQTIQVWIVNILFYHFIQGNLCIFALHCAISVRRICSGIFFRGIPQKSRVIFS